MTENGTPLPAPQSLSQSQSLPVSQPATFTSDIELAQGRYSLVKRLARGQHTETWAAKDNALQLDVAIKIPLDDSAANYTATHMLRSEVRYASRIDDPHVVRMRDFREEHHFCYLVMELLDGTTLAEKLAVEKRLTFTVLDRIVAGAAAGLAAVHGAGVVHRDIKPGNIFLTADGGVKLIDFGIATDDGSPAITALAQIPGTPDYISPEQVLGKAITPAVDIYALGVVIYEAITGHRPFEGETAEDIATARVMRPFPQIPGLLPAAELAMVGRMVATSPADRPSAQEVAEVFGNTPRPPSYPPAGFGG